MKKVKELFLSALAVCLVLALAACGSAEWTSITTDNVENYFDIDYGVDVVEKSEDGNFITEGQFFVSAAVKKSEYDLKDAELTMQVTYDVKTSSSTSTKTKQLIVSVDSITGNSMEMFFESYSDASEYPEITVKAVTVSAVNGSVKA